MFWAHVPAQHPPSPRFCHHPTLPGPTLFKSSLTRTPGPYGLQPTTGWSVIGPCRGPVAPAVPAAPWPRRQRQPAHPRSGLCPSSRTASRERLPGTREAPAVSSEDGETPAWLAFHDVPSVCRQGQGRRGEGPCWCWAGHCIWGEKRGFERVANKEGGGRESGVRARRLQSRCAPISPEPRARL